MLLPVLLLGLLGYGMPMSWTIKLAGFVAYLTILVGALARHVDYRIRVWLTVGAGYLFALLGSAGFPNAPFLRTLPFEHAIFVLVLTGQTSGRIATLISIGVLLLVPVLHAAPGMVPLLTGSDASPRMPMPLLLVQSINLTALLIGLILLLERFHAMLLHALAAQQQATDDLRRESAVRAEALQRLERAIDERRRLERELAQIGDEERRRMGQDVHDGVCQQLTGALLRCQSLERRLARGDSLPAVEVRALSQLLEETIDEAHNVAQGMHPLAPEPDALVRALRTLAKRTQANGTLRCRFIAKGTTDVPDDILAQHLYRIGQEAVSNAVRHAGAGQITITLQGNADEVVLHVEDDGCGLPMPLSTGGMGMRTMAFRTQSMEGILTVDNIPEGGTRVVCRVPLHQAALPEPVDILEGVTSNES
ncbi:MAG: sensor histidine kinase [Armatimonadota bacterium]